MRSARAAGQGACPAPDLGSSSCHRTRTLQAAHPQISWKRSRRSPSRRGGRPPLARRAAQHRRARPRRRRPLPRAARAPRRRRVRGAADYALCRGGRRDGVRAARHATRTTPLPCLCPPLIHISEPTRRYAILYAVFCLNKKTSVKFPIFSPRPPIDIN